jgi:hypothetical protein
MNRIGWIIVLVAVGVVAAIALGVAGTRNQPSKTEAANNLCASMKTLDSSIKTLTGLDPSTTTKSEFQSGVATVKSNWNQVKSDASDVQNASTSELDDAWNSFSTAVNDIPDDATVQQALTDISGAAQGVVGAAQTTASQLQNCSLS